MVRLQKEGEIALLLEEEKKVSKRAELLNILDKLKVSRLALQKK